MVVALSAVAGRARVPRCTACGRPPSDAVLVRDGGSVGVLPAEESNESAVAGDRRSDASEYDLAARVLMSVLASEGSELEGLVEDGPAFAAAATIVDVDPVSGFSCSLLGDASGDGVRGAEEPPGM